MSWTAAPLPKEAVDAIRPVAGRLVEEVVQSVRAQNPAYAGILTSPEGVGIRVGIEQAIESFLEAVERGERPRAATNEIWRRLGEAEFQAGRSLDALRAAWRTGTRAAWRGAAELGNEAGIPTSLVIALAEAIFVYTDELGTEVVEGYLRIQSDEAGERERRRRRLASLLIDGESHDHEAIEHAAELARWSLPQFVGVLALPGDSAGAIPRRLDLDVLAGADANGAFLVIPDPEGPRRQAALGRATADALAVLGPTVSVEEAERSLRWARLALALAQRGAIRTGDLIRTGGLIRTGDLIRTGGLIHAREHVSTMILLADEQLARAFASERLRPLLELSDPERGRLLETLTAWLDHQRHTPGIAAELHVHPQTVRYRIARLRELFGGALEEPEGRFELQMALRAHARLGA